MAKSILRKNLASAVIVSVLLVLVMFSFVVFLLLFDLNKSVNINKSNFAEADASNQIYLEQVEVKADLSRVIKDVNYTTLLTLDLIDAENPVKESRRIKVWTKRIKPVLDTLDAQVDNAVSDIFKKSFVRIYEEVNKNYILQESLLAKKDSATITPQEINEIKRSAEKLSENHSTFLSSQPDKNIVHFESVDTVNDNYMRLFAAAIAVIALIVFLINFLIRYLTAPIRKLNRYIRELKNGNSPDDISSQLQDYQSIVSGLKMLNAKLLEIKVFANLVAENNYEGQGTIRFERDGELGEALVQMQNNLEKRAVEDNQRSHVNRGLARFSEILSNYTNELEQFGDVVVKDFVDF